MEGKSSMAAKMDNKKKPAPTLLPVSMEKKNQQQQEEARAAPPDPFLDIDDVQLAILWTFLNAFDITVSFGIFVAYTFITGHASHASWLQEMVVIGTTDAEGTLLASDLVVGMLWCSTPQAAAGALALLLPRHRWRHRWRLRRAAAYAALALTAASHCMCAAVAAAAGVFVVRADPEDFFFTIAVTVGMFAGALGDLLGLLALLRGEWAT